jgi:predicted nucleic acid-binding protein
VKGWLLDTNVVSELRKSRPDPKVSAFVSAQPGDQLFISDVTLAEIVYGIEQLPDAARRADIHVWLQGTLRPLFAGRTLSITEAVLVRWKTLVVEGQKRGHTFGQPDLFIAALAILQDLVVVSRDLSEFIAAGTPVLDPWIGALHVNGTTTMIKGPATAAGVAKIIGRS